MANSEAASITYQIGKIKFVVTPMYQTERGETLAALLLRLMKADVERF
jgi:hypothetical protein